RGELPGRRGRVQNLADGQWQRLDGVRRGELTLVPGDRGGPDGRAGGWMGGCRGADSGWTGRTQAFREGCRKLGGTREGWLRAPGRPGRLDSQQGRGGSPFPTT